MCIPRTPLGGRNFEAYSEDPFLTGKLAASYINTIQAAGIGACIKHFAANDQETRRFFVDEFIHETALREIHLQPFQIAIRDSQPWTVMTAYNKINGTFCSMNSFLINDILRGQWGWNGLVMSDWLVPIRLSRLWRLGEYISVISVTHVRIKFQIVFGNAWSCPKTR